MLGNLLEVRYKLGCALWGHVVDNRGFTSAAGHARRCRCGTPYLQKDGGTTHVRHTLGCFLRHHTYTLLEERGGAREYVCVRCGHPLVFPAEADRFAGAATFDKRVRYWCGIVGHRVRPIARRDGFVEYACPCGHSFLAREEGAETIRHPLGCVLTAHRIRYLAARGGFSEYVCVDCGHPFCFADRASARVSHPGCDTVDGDVQGGTHVVVR